MLLHYKQGNDFCNFYVLGRTESRMVIDIVLTKTCISAVRNKNNAKQSSLSNLH